VKDAAYYLKTFVLMLLLTAESFFLTKFLLDYIRSEDYFTPPLKTLGIIVGLLLLVLYTYALTVGAWKKWEHFIVVPLPISLGIFIGLLRINSTYAVLVGVIAYVFLSYDVFMANLVKSQLIKFSPILVLRFATKAILFMFALLTSVMVFLHAADKRQEFDISSKIAEIAQTQVDKVMQPEVDKTEAPNILIAKLEGKSIPPNPELFSMLSGLQGGSSSFIGGLPTFNLDLKETVKKEVDNIIAPYKQFIPPLIALVVFALIRFIGGIANIIFNITVPLLFKFAKRVNLLHVEYVTVQKEELTFSAPKEKPKV
jgi:hypothetical protein